MKMRNIAANMLTILIVAGLMLLGAFGVYRAQVTAQGPHKDEVIYLVKRGAKFDRVADGLEKAGAIEKAWLFRVAGRLGGQAKRLRFGEYRIPAGASMTEIMELMTKGGNVRHRFTVPEGMTVAVVAERLKAEAKLTGEIKKLPAEGTLFPDTWEYLRGEKRTAILARMRTKMQKVLDEAWASRAPNHPLDTKEQLLILASIIEKETRPQEHAKVASVFVNRLIRGMRLQTDPTVIYGITKGRYTLGRGLKRSELRKPTRWNTLLRENANYRAAVGSLAA